MAIEFHCTSCGTRLRTSDETAGKQARCPKCGTLVPIPFRSEETPGDSGQEEVPGDTPPHPDAEPAPNPFADPPLVNPYATPVDTSGQAVMSPAEVRGKLMGPAIGMIVGAALSILYSLSNLVLTMTIGLEQLGAEVPNDPASRMVFHVAAGGIYIVIMTVPILVIVGAVSMLRMKAYTMAKVGTILAMVPCSCCFVISLPFAIWGLIVLSDVNVRIAFQSGQG